MKSDDSDGKIAIIGMAGRFPKAKNIDQFWDNLRNGVDCLSRFSDDELRRLGVGEEYLSDPRYVKAGYVLEGVDRFDADFFGYAAREAEMIDPQQRLFLETAWEALEDAGVSLDNYRGSIGVFCGSSPNDYEKRMLATYRGLTSDIGSFQAMLGNDRDFLATRLSYKLNLKGPSYTIQTGCSTSLVAVHVACQNLNTHQCDIALAGAVSIRLPQGVGYTWQEGMIWSPDGYCRSFDENANGTVFGSGVGVVVTKRLSDAINDRDHIYAVIRGSAVNNDGSQKAGFTAPGLDGQAEVIAMAHEKSGTSPETINYVEAHGTGTIIGDPIEIAALTKAFRLKTEKSKYCGLGSVKTNIGHLDAAAGMAGLIKTVLAMDHGELPPILNFKKPNPDIDFEDSPFFVVDCVREWQRGKTPNRAGVSSFGIGGTNAHIILEEAPACDPPDEAKTPQLILLSAKTNDALESISKNLAEYFHANPECSLPDVAFTLRYGRRKFKYRKAIVCRDITSAIEALSGACEGSVLDSSNAGNPSVIFMFSGQGSQYFGMCAGLYEKIPFFREQVDICAGKLMSILGLDIRVAIFSPDEKMRANGLIDQTWITQPALFTVEYSLAKLLMEWGIIPDAMIGHSIGEYVAACLSGVFSLNDALSLVAGRGRLIQGLSPGAMLSIPLSGAEIAGIMPRGICLAVTNSPDLTVVSGETETIKIFKESLFRDRGLECKLLHTSHAFHSAMMDPILTEFSALVDSFQRNFPTIPFISNVSGKWITDQEAVSSEYWKNHMRETVRFDVGMKTLFDEGFSKFVEVGPGQVLTGMARRNAEGFECVIVPTIRRPDERGDDLEWIFIALGRMWMAGVNPVWTRIFPEARARKVSLPPYAFQRKRYWLESNDNTVCRNVPNVDSQTGFPENVSTLQPEISSETNGTHIVKARNDLELQISNIVCNLLALPVIDVRDNFFNMGFDSIMAAQLLSNINNSTNYKLALVDIFKNPTVETLTKQVGHEDVRSHSPILPLNNAQNGHLVYFVVGIALYQELALCLQDVARCYGTFLPVEEALLLSGISYDTCRVSDLASAYRDVILKHSKGQPLSLVGISFGGVVAFELARQLTQEGVKVNLLTMLDSLLPSGVRKNYLKWLGVQIQKLRKQGLSYAPKILRAFFIPKERRIFSNDIKRAAGTNDQRLVVYADAVSRFEKTEAESSYEGKTLLIQAINPDVYQGYTVDPYYGWKKHVTGEFIIDYAPGDHLGILKPPYVAATANIIRKILSEMDRNI